MKNERFYLTKQGSEYYINSVRNNATYYQSDS